MEDLNAKALDNEIKISYVKDPVDTEVENSD